MFRCIRCIKIVDQSKLSKKTKYPAEIYALHCIINKKIIYNLLNSTFLSYHRLLKDGDAADGYFSHKE